MLRERKMKRVESLWKKEMRREKPGLWRRSMGKGREEGEEGE